MMENRGLISFPPAEFSVPLTVSIDGLRALIQTVLESGGCVPGWPAGRMALEEKEAAACIGVEPHVLRDARLRLDLHHARVGRTVTYTAMQLNAALQRLSAAD